MIFFITLLHRASNISSKNSISRIYLFVFVQNLKGVYLLNLKIALRFLFTISVNLLKLSAISEKVYVALGIRHSFVSHLEETETQLPTLRTCAETDK